MCIACTLHYTVVVGFVGMGAELLLLRDLMSEIRVVEFMVRLMPHGVGSHVSAMQGNSIHKMKSQTVGCIFER